MHMTFLGGVLKTTDYWGADDGAASGRGWCTIRGDVWHVMPPHDFKPDKRLKMAVGLPVLDEDSPGGWRWLLICGRRQCARMYLTADCFLGRVPALPEPGWIGDRTLIVYGHFLPGLGPVQWDFGHGLYEGVPVTARRDLLLCRKPPTGGKWGAPEWWQEVRQAMRR